MNKLVSRNPVLRFKLGRKIVKAQNGLQLLYLTDDNGITNEYWRGGSDWYYRPKGGTGMTRVDYSNKRFYSSTPRGAVANDFETARNYQHPDYSWMTKGTRQRSSAEQEALLKYAENLKDLMINDPRKSSNSPLNTGSRFWRKYANRANDFGADKIKEWQRKIGVTDDGIWGDESEAAYNRYLAEKNAPTSELLLSLVPQNTSTVETSYTDGTNTILNQLAMMQNIPQTGEDILQKQSDNNKYKTLNPLNRSDTRWIINDVLGKNAYNFTGNLRKALRQYLNGEEYNADDLTAFGDLNAFSRYKYKNGGNIMNTLPSRNIVERFKQGRKIIFALKGLKTSSTKPLKRFGLSYYDDIEKNYVTLDFDTEELAKAARKQLGLPGRITDRGEAWKGNVIKTDRTKEKSTAYARLLEESPYNNLSFKDAYALARKNNKKYFGYKGKVYKSDLENGEDNITDLMGIYGNNLGYSKDPKLQTPKSRKAREQYRTDAKASDKYKGENLLLIDPVEEARKKRMAEEYVNLVWGPDHQVEFVDAFMPTNAVGNLINKGASVLTGEKFTPKNYASGFNLLGYGRALGKIYDGDIAGGLAEGAIRGFDAYATLGMPGAGAFVDRTLTRFAPRLLQVSSKSRYVPLQGGKGIFWLNHLKNGSLTPGAWNMLAKGGNRNTISHWSKGIRKVTEGGRRSMQRAIDEGFKFTGFKGADKAAQHATNFGQNVNTGTTFFFRGAPTAYDIAADRAVQLTPWSGIPVDIATQQLYTNQ